MKTTPPAETPKSDSDPQRGAATAEVIEMVPRVLRIQHLLVPIDFSAAAEKALRYAVSFAEQFDARITLLHVQPGPYYLGEIGEFPTAIPAPGPSTETLQARLEAEAKRLIPAGVLERTLCRVGPAFDEICNAAREMPIDLIIISTHGHTGLKHVLLGSTAERVVRHAPCPVLVVREHEREFA